MKKQIVIKSYLIGTIVLFFSLISFTCCVQSKKSSETIEAKQPNLLYVFPDQYRLHAMGFWKKEGFNHLLRTETDPVNTPNIDRLAEKGLVFTQATSTHPVCSPHRAMLMSGMYPSRNGVEDWNCKAGRTQGLHNEIECFTDVLAKAGYETAYVGKTHWERTEPLFDEDANYVGTNENPGGHYANTFDTYIPPGRGRHGNKYWFQIFTDNHFKAKAYSNQPDLVKGKEDGKPLHTSDFNPKIEADVVIKFLNNTNGERNPNKPFSIFWAPNPPHNPYFEIEDCEEDIYNDLYKNMPLDEQLYRGNFKSRLASEPEIYDAKKNTAIYYSLVSGIDRQFGRIMKALEASGEADNTIVIFTSDHGEMMGSHGVSGKNYAEDESFLVPYIIYYPKKIKHRVDDLLLASIDIMPSVLGLMGLEDMIPATVEGTNYSKGLETGDYSNCPKPKSALYLNVARKGVRTNRYTYVVHDDGRAEVTDNINDPYQINKLAPDAIPANDLKLLKSELGMRLILAGDGWATEQKFPELISY